MVCIRARIILTSNLWTKLRLVNRSMGSIYNITWDKGVSISALLLILLVRFNKYTGLDFILGSPGIVPIFSVT